ncbi:MAG: hypothetical protein HYZ69_03465 [Candidatus Colwellbacteria bacterium]|nr:hypothetical protein [Candidatus Colwellbacteria bacterium]
MERMFTAKRSRDIAFFLVGGIIFFFLRPTIIGLIGAKLFSALTSGQGALTVLLFAAALAFIAIVGYAQTKTTRTFQPQPRQQ